MSYTRVQVVRCAMHVVNCLACAAQRLAESLHKQDARLTLGVAEATYEHTSETFVRRVHERQAAWAMYRKACRDEELAHEANGNALEVLRQNKEAVLK